MSGTRAISTKSRRELSLSFFFLQGKAPKEFHAILTETPTCFLPGRSKDLSASLYIPIYTASYCNRSTESKYHWYFLIDRSVEKIWADWWFGQICEWWILGHLASHQQLPTNPDSIPGRRRTFSSSESSTPYPTRNQPPIQWITRSFSQG